MNTCSIKTIIVDDEQLCIDNIANELEKYPEFELVATTKHATEAKNMIITHKPDVLFLDIELIAENGICMLQSISDRINWPMTVIFCTSHNKYLLETLRAGAFDFILKPFDANDFEEAMQRFFKNRRGQISAHNLKLGNNLGMERKSLLFINTNIGIEKFETNKILYFEYSKTKKTWFAYRNDTKEIALKRCTKAKDIVELDENYAQINQYQILNCNYVAAVSINNVCQLMPPFNKTFCLSRRYQNEIFDRIALL